MFSMTRQTALFFVMCLMVLLTVAAQAPTTATPDFNGAWGPYRGGRGANAQFAAPPASPIVLKPQFAKAWEERRAAQTAATQRGEPLATNGALCVPYGFPTMMSVAVYPVEFVQTAKQITVVTEAFSEVRRIYLGKPQLPIDEVPPGYYGRSVGRWEGDTLVVDTVGIRENTQYQNVPHSDQMRITERIRLVAPNILHDQITIEDPVYLEKPIVYTLAYQRLQNYEMVEFVCDNNREFVDEKGVVRMRVREK